VPAQSAGNGRGKVLADELLRVPSCRTSEHRQETGVPVIENLKNASSVACHVTTLELRSPISARRSALK